MCCAGEDQAALLITDEKKVGSVWLRIFSVQRQCKIWEKRPVNYNDREQCIAMIACGKMHCAALTTTGRVFICVLPSSEDLHAYLLTWTLTEKLVHFDTGNPQKALQKIVDDIDVEILYKRCCAPMAASFGVTGGLRNPYLLNINTDGEALDRVIAKHKRETEVRVAENRKALNERVEREKKMSEQMEHERQRIKDLEEEINNHENSGETHKNNLENAAQRLEEAKKAYEEAHSKHSLYETKLQSLKKKLHNEETVIGTKSVPLDTRSTNPHNYPEVDNRSTASSETKRQGASLRKAVTRFFGGRPSKLENELNFEDITNFNSSRENRCTYI